jgi:hypothetical protein
MSDESEDKFLEKTTVSYKELFRMRFEGIVDIFSVFAPLAGTEQAKKIVAELAARKSVEGLKVELAEKEPIQSFADFKRVLLDQLNSDFMRHTTTIEVVEDSEKKLALKYTACLWAKTMHDLGHPELGQLICCKPDYAMTQAYHPNVRLTRTKTLMQGDDHCNHTYTWEEKKKEE